MKKRTTSIVSLIATATILGSALPASALVHPRSYDETVNLLLRGYDYFVNLISYYEDRLPDYDARIEEARSKYRQTRSQSDRLSIVYHKLFAGLIYETVSSNRQEFNFLLGVNEDPGTDVYDVYDYSFKLHIAKLNYLGAKLEELDKELQVHETSLTEAELNVISGPKNAFSDDDTLIEQKAKLERQLLAIESKLIRLRVWGE